MPMRNVVKKLQIYQNGDPASLPQSFTYSSKVVTTWDHLIDDITTRVMVKGGRVKYLWSTDGKTEIKSIEDLQSFDEGALVAGGKYDRYQSIEGGYESIGRQSSNKSEQENMSYVERNKKKYRSQAKPKIQDRFDRGNIKKFWIYANGSTDNGIMYTLKPKQVARTWEQLMDDLGRIAPPQGGAAKWLCTIEGEEVKDFNELEDGSHYVVVGQEGFFIPKGGYGLSETGENTEKLRTDEERLAKHRTKTSQAQRSDSAKVFNRKDQIKPDSLFLFVFRNGNGIEHTRHIFTAKQLERGMNWLLEQIARRYSVNPKRLCTMDGRDVMGVADLNSKGAFVLVPLGEKFRDTWYYLPDGAIDTSEPAYDESGQNPNSRAVSQASTKRPDSAVTNRDSDIEEYDREDTNYSFDREGSDASLDSGDSRTESDRNSKGSRRSRQNSSHDPVVAGLMGIRKTRSKNSLFPSHDAQSRRDSTKSDVSREGSDVSNQDLKNAYETIGKHIEKTTNPRSRQNNTRDIPDSAGSGKLRRSNSDASLFEKDKEPKRVAGGKKVKESNFSKSGRFDMKSSKKTGSKKKK